jgi:subtilase family serine protease
MRKAAVVVLAVTAALACAGPAAALPHSPATGLSHRDVCAIAPPGSASCDAALVTNKDGSVFGGQPNASVVPAGYGPADLQSAYALNAPSGAPGTGPTIAIVDAYDDPYAATNLSTYRSQYGLGTCSTGCFTKVNQNGATFPTPRGNTGWAQEISLDLDMASATCPNCKILLVEANSSSFNDLSTAVATAYRMGASSISNSYGGSEFSGEASYQSAYNHPGVTVSSGDSGYGVEFPASSQYVTAVGGTSLTRASNARGWTETTWNGAGSGCSAYITKPQWQNDTVGCARRTVADVSAVADPNTGVAVYDTYGTRGWVVFGGTSVASPIIAGVYALAGNTGSIGIGAGHVYANAASLFDVTSGSNGSCGGSYLCTAGTGFDGPTGLGTPNGTAAF